MSGLKVDRTFVSGARSGERDADIVTGLISLGHSLGLDVVLEGVESTEQHERFAGHGVSVQGFLFARPMTPAEVERFLADRPPIDPPTTQSDSGASLSR